jgi:hypothetical protein
MPFGPQRDAGIHCGVNCLGVCAQRCSQIDRGFVTEAQVQSASAGEPNARTAFTEIVRERRYEA